MFRFANYVFGTEVESNSDNENIDINQCIEHDIDDDWILIDMSSDDNKNNNSEDIDGKELSSIDANYETTTNRVPQSLTTSDAQNDDNTTDHYSDTFREDNIIYFSPNAYEAMEESWFMDPPPCFNSLTHPVNIETTPLENLLIEHPSMSVFGPSLPPIDHRSSHSSTLLPTDMSSNGSTQPSRRQMRQLRRQQQLSVQNRPDNQMNINLHLRSGKT